MLWHLEYNSWATTSSFIHLPSFTSSFILLTSSIVNLTRVTEFWGSFLSFQFLWGKKILIIGNGFDLDLGMKSRYRDFMVSDLWQRYSKGELKAVKYALNRLKSSIFAKKYNVNMHLIRYNR